MSSLRVRLAVPGFLAIYLPALLLFGVSRATDVEVVEEGGTEAAHELSSSALTWTGWTVIALAPAAAALAWWWAGRAVRPIDLVRAVADDIEGTDLGRRINLTRGPAEVVALAASFDAMFQRVERGADEQRRLIEEISHELRRPLAVLMTNADVLLAHPDPTIAAYRQGLERSRAAATRLKATINELLIDARGRARTIDRRPTDLMAIVRSVRDEAAAGGILLSVTGPASAPCAVDGTSIRRAVSNLVENAIRHAPDGSAVEVEVDVTGHEAVVTVTDHGDGIRGDDLGHVFERFWRGRPDRPGTGLGLPIARHIALAHGGDLTVTSPGPAGDGCVFRLTLRTGPPEPEPVSPRSTGARPAGTPPP
ncbi:sensor histidine kinase [Pseudonocardia cypriaca]|uniref:histidine kinase n=1 Tax=Pseudonocardia cypriaca TaxID=882449 RepID=A0A543FPG2_9PSEU|nr:HAMP domain-containing sensor histidine kinase [Pseudonocardia cypriaca]TQM35735.1 signal transduction histidine kinase [Pseudonocardia cypriaca]